MGRWVSLDPSEAERLGGAGHRKEKDRREDGGPWYGCQKGIRRDLEQFSDF
jgi:hypothetical protein